MTMINCIKIKPLGFFYLLFLIGFVSSACTLDIKPTEAVNSSFTTLQVVNPSPSITFSPSPTSTTIPAATSTQTPIPTATFTSTPPAGGNLWLAFVARDSMDQPYLALGNLNRGEYYMLVPLKHSNRYLSRNPNAAFALAWSMDGSSIFYSNGSKDRVSINLFDITTWTPREIYLLPLVSKIEKIVWSPNSSYLYYDLWGPFRDLRRSRWILNLESGKSWIMDLDNNVNKEREPGWSADGQHLYYNSSAGYFIDYDLNTQARRGINSLVLSKSINLVDGNVISPYFKDCWIYSHKLDAFILQALLIRSENHGRYPMGVFVLPKDGSPGNVVYQSDKIYGRDDSYSVLHDRFEQISVSPSGNWIYLGSSKKHGAYIVNLKDSRVVPLSRLPKWFLNWSPDDKAFAAITDDGGKFTISLFDNATGGKKITYSLPNNLYPAFQTCSYCYQTVSLFWPSEVPTQDIQFTEALEPLSLTKASNLNLQPGNLPTVGPAPVLDEALKEWQSVEKVHVSQIISKKTIPLEAGKAFLALLKYSPSTRFFTKIFSDQQKGYNSASISLEIIYSVVTPWDFTRESHTYDNRFDNISGDFKPVPNQWFYIMAAIDPKFRQYRFWLWDPQNPSWDLRIPGHQYGSLVGFDWENFKIEVLNGSVFLDSVEKFSFNGFK